MLALVAWGVRQQQEGSAHSPSRARTRLVCATKFLGPADMVGPDRASWAVYYVSEERAFRKQLAPRGAKWGVGTCRAMLCKMS